jgi:TPR repeat protein
VYAQYNIACYYMEGRGLPVDLSAAVYWFKKAAEKGNPPSQRRYGLCLIKGIGTAKDRAEGLLWLNRAGENGDKEAQRLLLDGKI